MPDLENRTCNMRLSLPVLLLCLGLGGLSPLFAQASAVDLSIAASSIKFSETTLYSGETVRIYATIKNSGDTDSTAQVFFYQSDYLIGKSQPVSVLAGGGSDDVFVDYKLPTGSFNIRAVIQGANPVDGNAANDTAITPLFKTVSDDDRDGVLNENDNCVEDANADQADLDADGRGDVCDSDLDNDGVSNGDDDYPRDASKSKDAPPPVVIETPKVTPKVEVPIVTVPVPTPVVQPVVTTSTSGAEPVPEVMGVQDTQLEDQAVIDGEQVAFDLSGLGYGGPVASPAARFTVEQKNWHTYEFVAVPPLGGGDYTFAWDFGDGATSVQSNITHTFSTSGSYTVTLATVAADGTVTSDTQKLSVSFFHLANPLLLLTLGALGMILIGLLTLIFRLRKGEEV